MKLACAERERVHNLSLRTAASVPGRSSGGRSPALRWLVMRAATNALMGPVDWQRSIIEVHFHIHQLSEGSGGGGWSVFQNHSPDREALDASRCVHFKWEDINTQDSGM